MTGVALFPISQSNPEAQFEPKEKLGTIGQGVEDRGSGFSRVHSFAPFSTGTGGKVHLHPGIMTMNLSHNIFLSSCVTRGCYHTPPFLLKPAVNQDSS
jgi:hypothetical protein